MKCLLSLLVAWHVLIGTLGQGALTLCVRSDGSHHLEWTALSDCKAQARLHQEIESLPLAAAISTDQIECDPCTDYLLVADAVYVAEAKPVVLDDACHGCIPWLALPLETASPSTCIIVGYHGPPLVVPQLISSVILRL